MTCSCEEKSVPRVGRYVTEETSLAEPLIAIAEDSFGGGGCSVGACGPCHVGAQGGHPKTLRIEKAHRTSAGYEFVTVGEEALPSELTKTYEAASCVRSPACLPWVRVTRNPEHYRTCLQQARSLGTVENSEVVYQLLKKQMGAEDQEVFYVLLLDSQHQIRGISELSRGARDSVQAPIPDALRLVLIEGASSFIIAHNHPSGKVKPSKADKMLTRALSAAGDKIDIPMLDHVVIGVDNYYSFADHRLI